MTGPNSPIAVLANGRSHPAQAATEFLLPRGAAVVRACTSVPTGGHRHPLLDAARALAAVHCQRAHAQQLLHGSVVDDHTLAAAARTASAADTGRLVLVDTIDQWACTVLPANRDAAVHTESLGQLVDRMTGAWTRWALVKEYNDPAAVDLAHDLLHHVGELTIGFDDLIADLAAGRRRLPRHPNPVAA